MNRICGQFCNTIDAIRAEGVDCTQMKKLRGALFAEIIKSETERELNTQGYDKRYEVSSRNCYILGSKRLSEKALFNDDDGEAEFDEFGEHYADEYEEYEDEADDDFEDDDDFDPDDYEEDIEWEAETEQSDNELKFEWNF